MSQEKKHLVIVGGGFAGVYTARHLRKRLPRDWEIVLFSKENHLIFTPLLGDVVGSTINPAHVVWPIRQMVRNATCRTAELTAIDLEQCRVRYRTTIGHFAEQPFDQLVVACGSVVKLDIIPGMVAHGWALKTTGDALLLRNHIIGLLEKAEVETDPDRKRRLLSVVVVGAGYSGVEVAGEVYDLLVDSVRFYQSIHPLDIRVTLLEGQDRIMPGMPESLSAFAEEKMSKRGINIRTGVLAKSVTEHCVTLKSGEEIAAETVICTIGTTASPLVVDSGLPLERNRIKTGADMRVQGHDNVWALGDCAAVPNEYDDTICAPTAQFATRQAKVLADNIVRAIDDVPTRPFSYKPLGMLASIGNYNAVALVFGIKLSGFLAWFMWRGIYLFKMPTLARKIQIAFDWAWDLVFPRDIVQIKVDETERLSRAHFEQGQWVFHKGDPGDKFYVIQQGRASVYLDESAEPVTHLVPGDHFGEGALLQSKTRSASVRADEPLDVLMVDPSSFEQLTKHMEVLRSALERSIQSNRSAAALLSLAKDNPKLNQQPIASVMSSPVETLSVNLSFRDALSRSQEAGKGAYPVVDDERKMVGICTRTDFYRALEKLSPPETPISEVMRKPVITVRDSDSLADALLIFVRETIKRVVVVSEDGDPVGIVTPFDILQSLAESLPSKSQVSSSEVVRSQPS